MADVTELAEQFLQQRYGWKGIVYVTDTLNRTHAGGFAGNVVNDDGSETPLIVVSGDVYRMNQVDEAARTVLHEYAHHALGHCKGVRLAPGVPIALGSSAYKTQAEARQHDPKEAQADAMADRLMVAFRQWLQGGAPAGSGNIDDRPGDDDFRAVKTWQRQQESIGQRQQEVKRPTRRPPQPRFNTGIPFKVAQRR